MTPCISLSVTVNSNVGDGVINDDTYDADRYQTCCGNFDAPVCNVRTSLHGALAAVWCIVIGLVCLCVCVDGCVCLFVGLLPR